MMNNNFNIKKEYSDNKYSLYSITNDNYSFRRIICERSSICILPFEVNEFYEIKNIYLFKYLDIIKNSIDYSCITIDFNEENNESYFEVLTNLLISKFNIENINIEDIFYIGTITHNLPFSKTYKCYAINLSDYEFNKNNLLSNNNSIDLIDSVNFNKILNGEITDSLILSSSFLLLSYFK